MDDFRKLLTIVLHNMVYRRVHEDTRFEGLRIKGADYISLHPINYKLKNPPLDPIWTQANGDYFLTGLINWDTRVFYSTESEGSDLDVLIKKVKLLHRYLTPQRELSIQECLTTLKDNVKMIGGLVEEHKNHEVLERKLKGVNTQIAQIEDALGLISPNGRAMRTRVLALSKQE